MLVVRVGLAYILVYVFGVNIWACWIATVADWFVRAFFFMRRFHSNKWMQKRVI